MAYYNNPAPLRFLSIPSETLHRAREGPRPSRSAKDAALQKGYESQHYSALGARILAGSRAAAEVGEVAFDLPNDSRPPEIEDQWSWEKEITWIWCKERSRDTQSLYPFEFLYELRSPQDRSLALQYVSPDTNQQTTTQDLTPRFYSARATAIHLACPVELFDPSFISDPLQSFSVWEPHFVPSQFNFKTLGMVKTICKTFDVFAPSDVYLEQLFGAVERDMGGRLSVPAMLMKDDKARRRSVVERRATELVLSGVGYGGKKGAVIVRSGRSGCLVATRCAGHTDSVRCDWLPPVYDAIFHYMDSTEHPSHNLGISAPGVGTIFVGALTYAMGNGHSALEAAKQAAVATTFLMQLGYLRNTASSWSDGRIHWYHPVSRVNPEVPAVTARDLQPFYYDGEEYWIEHAVRDRIGLFKKNENYPLGLLKEEFFGFLDYAAPPKILKPRAY